MTYNATALKIRIEELQRELDRCKMCLEEADLPDEPIIMGVPKFVTFVKRFGRSTGKAYTYAAVAPVANHWFITGRRAEDWSDQGMTWKRLMEFMVSEETETSRAQVIATFRELS